MSAYRKILLPTAFTESCECARAHAVALARRFGAELHVLHVQVLHAEPLAFSELPGVSDIEAALTQAAHTQADAFIADIDVPVTKAIAREITASPAILDYAEAHDCDVIVMGTHARKGLAHLFLGSEAVEVVRRASMPVLVVGPSHADAPPPYKTILAPVDFSMNARKALEMAANLLPESGGRLIVEHVVDTRPLPPYATETVMEEERERAESALDALMDEMSLAVEVERVISVGVPYERISESARERNADLVVMGTQGLGALDRLLLGSVTERVLRIAPCPVLASR